MSTVDAPPSEASSRRIKLVHTVHTAVKAFKDSGAQAHAETHTINDVDKGDSSGKADAYTHTKMKVIRVTAVALMVKLTLLAIGYSDQQRREMKRTGSSPD